jgi:hypothetical protein
LAASGEDQEVSVPAAIQKRHPRVPFCVDLFQLSIARSSSDMAWSPDERRHVVNTSL